MANAKILVIQETEKEIKSLLKQESHLLVNVYEFY